MTPEAFVAKWQRFEGKETSGYVSHFDDLCRMLGHETPAEADPSQSFFCFQKAVTKNTGRPGFADVFYRRRFGWEYKGNHKDLDEAYQQLLRYRENLENPPLLIVGDFRQMIVRTNFTNSITRTYKIALADLTSGEKLPGAPFTAMEILREAFDDPTTLNPATTPAAMTEGAAKQFERLADSLRNYREGKFDRALGEAPRQYTDDQVAKFLTRVIFVMFASDVGLLPANIMTRLIDNFGTNSGLLRDRISELFRAMRTGDYFGSDTIPFFNGGLFDDDEALSIDSTYVSQLKLADQLDWSDIEPSIFGTLFERILDPKRRKQIGAHYTSREDIELIVQPVLMEPFEREWKALESEIAGLNLFKTGPGVVERRAAAQGRLQAFIDDQLAKVRVLDPACGSGNFLYVSLALLKGLEQRIVSAGASWGITGLTHRAHPRQLFGLELDPYAHELASIVVWIGYLQWKKKNGVPFETESPILEPFRNFKLMDALVGRTESGRTFEPEWPEADVIVGNPPFLGGKLLRRGIGDAGVDALFEVWNGRVPREADLCCYFFEKARAQIAFGSTKRAGLLATQGIRGGRNREVLKAIKRSGDIFFAVDDRKWVLDGAAVQVSMVGFDDGSEKRRVLLHHKGGKVVERIPVEGINADLTAQTDVTQARRLPENIGLAFQGTTKYGPFDLTEDDAQSLIAARNPDGRPNSDVIRRWINARDITESDQHAWVIDFPHGMSQHDAALYERPYSRCASLVRPVRTAASLEVQAAPWWVHWRPRPEMRAAIAPLSRFLATPRVSKHRVWVWFTQDYLPSDAVAVVARDDDYFPGVIHSRVHETWARATGTQLREEESGFRYTPTSCFETFPLPFAPGAEDPNDAGVIAISEAATELDRLREGALRPRRPDGALWDPALVKQRSLTALYNERPQWLLDAHRRLDEAVIAAYGWSEAVDEVTDEEILARLMKLNLERARAD